MGVNNSNALLISSKASKRVREGRRENTSHLKTTSSVPGLQKLGAHSWSSTYRAPKTSIRYTKKPVPKIINVWYNF